VDEIHQNTHKIVKTKLQNAISYYQRHGMSNFIKRIFVGIGFKWFTRTLIFLKLDMSNLSEKCDKTQQWSFKIVNSDEIIAEANYDDGFFNKAKALQRISSGHRLFALEEGGREVFFLWVEKRKASVWWFDDLPLWLPANYAYISGVYTFPDFRKRGIASRMKREIFTYLREVEGVNCLIEVVHPNNHVALKMDEALGFRKYQIVTYRRYWHIRHYSVTDAKFNQKKTIIRVFSAPRDVWKIFF